MNEADCANDDHGEGDPAAEPDEPAALRFWWPGTGAVPTWP